MNFGLESLGAVTAVGRNLSLTMASIHTRTQRYDDLEVRDAAGQPLSGARTPLEETDVIARLGHLVALALADCATRAPEAATRPVVIQGPDELVETGAQRVFLEKLLATLPPEIRARLRMDRLTFVTAETGAFGEALQAAKRLVGTGAHDVAAGCYVVSVDCLTAPEKAQELMREGRLLTPGGARGFLPGEGAVALLATFGAVSRNGLGAAAAFEREVAKPSSGQGITRAVCTAFELARVPAASSAELGFVHDTAFDRRRGEELSYARSRPPLVAAADLRDVSPLLSTGELGVASTALCLATAAFLLEKGVFPAAALAVSGDDGGARSAIVVSRAPGQARGR